MPYEKKYTITEVNDYLANKQGKGNFILVSPHPLHLFHNGKKIEWKMLMNDYIYLFDTLDTIYIDFLKASIPFMIRVYWSSGSSMNHITFLHEYTLQKKLRITKVRGIISYSKNVTLNDYEKELIETARIMDLI